MEFWPEVVAKVFTYAPLLLLLGAVCVRLVVLPRAVRIDHASRVPAQGVVEWPAASALSPGPAPASEDEEASAGRALDRIVFACALALVVGLLLRAVAHTVAAFGVADAWSPENLSLIAVESRWGVQWQRQVLVALALLVAAALGRVAAPARLASALLAAALCFVMPGLGHAAGDTSRVIVHGVHLAAGGLWLGSLAAMVLLPASNVAGLRVRLLSAFAPLAMTGVGLLVLTGGLATWTYLGAITNLVTTGYGRLLGVKLLFVLDALVLGGLNWNSIHRQGRPPALGLAAAEAATALLIVAVTAWLTETAHP